MGRDASRQIRADPGGDHVMVQRNDQGVVQMTTETSTTGVDPGTTGSGTVTVATLTLTNPQLVCHTSATATIAGGGTQTTMVIQRNGSSVANTTTGVGSTSTNATHTTPLNAPSYNVQVQAAGSTPTAVTLNLQREQRWVGGV